LLREEFGIATLTFHSDLRRRAASRRALPYPSSFTYFENPIKVTFYVFNQSVYLTLFISMTGVNNNKAKNANEHQGRLTSAQN